MTLALKITEIAKGVEGYYIENTRFNTTQVTYNFYVPQNAQTMATDTLLPYLLTSCCDRFRDYIALNLRLLELYGADLSCSATKCGDSFLIKMGISSVRDSFSFDSSRPATEAAELLSSMIFEPALYSGAFGEKDIEREKRKTIERIEGEINNKRSFARTRLFEEMFGDDPYGKFSYGTVEEVKAMSGNDLLTAWQKLLKTAYVRIIAVGDTYPSEIFAMAEKGFSKIERENTQPPKTLRFLPERDTPRIVTEHFDVTQGKLAMGFTSSLRGNLTEATALSVCTDIFGGGPYSKLFENVREKQSLCYYCSASSRRSKGFVLVESGIEEQNADTAYNAILKELEDMKKGIFEDSTLEASKLSIIDSLSSYYDNASAIDGWYSRNLDEHLSPEEAAELVRAVTREDVIRAAQGINLHTVYRLLPEKEGE